jgi:hypothetical protein
MKTTVEQLVLERRSGRADCPVQRHRSYGTISVSAFGDGTVGVHPFCGCHKKDVLEASRLRWSDLFPPRTPTERQAHQERACARRQQKAARDKAVTTICTLLREADTLILGCGEALQFASAHGLDTDSAWDRLKAAFELQHELEEEFRRLNPRYAEVHG